MVRSPENAAVPEGMTVHRGDATQPEQLAPRLRGYDAVISAATFQVLKSAPLLQAVKASSVKRLLVVGGAASLEVAPGTLLLDSQAFPDAYKAEAIPGKQFLDDLRAETELDWTFLSPSAMFAQGERTGKFRIGKDQLLLDESGRSRISMEDFAVAMVDELEQPQHVRQRFTVGY